MTARCGSYDETHRAEQCRECQDIYRERERSGAPPFGQRMLARGARCEFCDLVAGNGQGVRVYRYTLRRSVFTDGKRTSRALGSIGLCDNCLTERGLLHERAAYYMKPRQPLERDDGLRSYDGMPTRAVS